MVNNEKTAAPGMPVRILPGNPISPGVISGKAVLVDCGYLNAPYPLEIPELNIPEELARMKRAFQIMRVVCQCCEDFFLQTRDATGAEIFTRHGIDLEDCHLIRQIAAVIEQQRCRCGTALQIVLSGAKHRLLNSEGAKARQRLSEINDLIRLFADVLNSTAVNMEDDAEKPGPMEQQIAVARELTTRLVIEQYILHRKAIIVEQGIADSNAAVLCRSLNMPAILGIYRAPDLFATGAEIVVNGDSAQLVLLPAGTLRNRGLFSARPATAFRESRAFPAASTVSAA